MCPELYLLRHGQSEWNAARRHQGQLDGRLTALGREQAHAMGDLLAREIGDPFRFTALASPLQRAWQTAEIALAPLGLAARSDARLTEVHFGAWQGLTDPEIFERHPWAEAPRTDDPFMWNFMAAPGGETLPQMSDRLQAVLDDLAGPAILVAHGMALRVLRGLCLGLDSAGMRDLPGGQGVVWRLRDGVHEVLGV
jgi:probable phosphoglycerate mutase